LLLGIIDGAQQGKFAGFVIGDDDTLRYENRLCVPDVGDLRRELITKAPHIVYTVHPSSTKKYKNLKVCY